MITELDNRIYGTNKSRIIEEFFSNSAHFPIVLIFVELFTEGFYEFIREPDLYAISFSALLQAHFIGNRYSNSYKRQLFGNLIGPSVYTIFEVPIEGLVSFLSNPIHTAYWCFSLTIGISRSIQLHTSGNIHSCFIIIENIVRTNILFVGYWIFEVMTEDKYTDVSIFFSNMSHLYIFIVITLSGLIIGVSKTTNKQYMDLLRRTATQLKEYSQWLLGDILLTQAVTDPLSLSLQRINRYVLFMDIRGFTKWCESQMPEDVVKVVNNYYLTAETVWSKFPVIKTKLTGDEVLIVFSSGDTALKAALLLRERIEDFLGSFGLSAGIGVHSGPLIEGLVGSKKVKAYDIIGDTVNTAKRLCDNAIGGEILISDGFPEKLRKQTAFSGQREIMVKGKNSPIKVYSVKGLKEN